MICARCDEPIRPDEPYETVERLGATGAGATLYTHKKRCEPVRQQTYPARRFGA